MLENAVIKPITGSFVNMLISDTGIVNGGLKEWEQDFRMMKAIGMDHLFVIRTEVEENGICLSAEDPRSTTWKEDANLLDMVSRQGDYRTLYMKLAEASPLVDRIITYEYFSCLSPNTEWGSSRRLLARYLEMIGKDTALIDEIYN